MPSAHIFPETYQHTGIKYKDIVNELITLYGGTPQVGNRENTIFRLASDLSKITDRSVPWLESLIPTFGLPEAEWRATISQVCKKPLEASVSRKLQEAISRCRQAQAGSEEETINVEDYVDDFPKEKLPALIQLLTSRCMPHMKAAVANMTFPALATHVYNAKFTFSDKSKQELGLMLVLIGKQSSGKSCIDEPIHLITRDIEATDAINRLRKKEWSERQKNKKANERGEKRPEGLVIRCIGGNVTNAALLELLEDAQNGDPEKPNQPIYSKVSEIQQLYQMANNGNKLGVADLIKYAYDRATLDSNRSTLNAVNAYTPARWNMTASTTPSGARKFFNGDLLTDGTLGRMGFILLPDVRIPSNDFHLGDYDEDFIKKLQPFIENLNNYKHPTDEEGNALPLYVKEADMLRRKINDKIDVDKLLSVNEDLYTAFAYRTRDIVIRQAITTYIANGCQWEDCDDYWLWTYDKYVEAKLIFFGEAAAEGFKKEKPRGHAQWTPLREMKREFTLEEFTRVCERNRDIINPNRSLDQISPSF